MSETELPVWAEVATAADRLALACSPAELHGALCGWLAAGGADAAGWPALVMADPALPVPAPGDPLDRLRGASAAQLGDPEFGFQLLLPEGGKPIDRAGALFAWCRAFLGGFGLALDGKPMSVERLEWEYIQRVLHENGGNISATARALSMHRRTLQRKLRKRPTKA